MTDDQEHIEADFAKQFKKVEDFYDRGEYREALDLLGELDKEFPHTRKILFKRNQCLQALGIATFLHEDDEDAQSKESVAFESLEVEWDAAPVKEAEREPQTRRRDTGVPPPMWDPLKFVEAPRALPVEERDPLIYRIAFGVMLGLFAVALLNTIFWERPAGYTKEFSGIAFVWVPPETPEDTSARLARTTWGISEEDAQPLEGYWISKYELTRAQWLEVMAPLEEGRRMSRAEYPVSNVNLDDCLDFVDNINRRGEGLFRLPTEAEWERASRAESTAPGPRFADAEALRSEAVIDGVVREVGTKEPNAWGLYDMYGNVGEWCGARDERARGTWEAVGLSGIRRAVVRGGDATSEAAFFDEEPRTLIDRETEDPNIGFRLVREAGEGVAEDLRLLRFPDDRSLGTLYVRDIEIGPAQGVVYVFKDDELTLDVGNGEGADLSPLAEQPAELFRKVAINDPAMEERQLAHIAHFSKLKELQLGTMPITDAAVPYLPSFRELVVLDLSGTQVTGESFPVLGSMRSLRKLNLRRLEGVDDTQLQALAKLEALRVLDLEGTVLGGRALMELQIALPQCEILPDPGTPTLEQSLKWASVGGRYSMLLRQIKVNTLEKEFFKDIGYQKRDLMERHRSLPYGYWVHVRPYWYIWAERDIRADAEVADWSPRRVVGKAAIGGDDHGGYAWSPDSESTSRDWLMVEFARPVVPRRIRLYESSTTSYLERTSIFDLEGNEITVLVGESFLRTDVEGVWLTNLGVTDPNTLEAIQLKTSRVKFYFRKPDAAANETAAEEVVGAGLVGVEGDAQWAASAVASSARPVDDAPEAETAPQRLPELPQPEDAVQFRGFLGIVDYLGRREHGPARPQETPEPD